MVGVYCRIWDLWFGCWYLSQVVRSLICLWVFVTVCECLISLCGFIQGVRSVQFAALCGFMSKNVFLSAICVCMSQMVSLIPSDWGLWALLGYVFQNVCLSVLFGGIWQGGRCLIYLEVYDSERELCELFVHVCLWCLNNSPPPRGPLPNPWKLWLC